MSDETIDRRGEYGEPWDFGTYIKDACEEPVALVHEDRNASRIVTCVNALAGRDPTIIEQQARRIAELEGEASKCRMEWNRLRNRAVDEKNRRAEAEARQKEQEDITLRYIKRLHKAEAQVATLTERAERAERREVCLREALEFYGNIDTHTEPMHPDGRTCESAIHQDGGDKARTALDATKETTA